MSDCRERVPRLPDTAMSASSIDLAIVGGGLAGGLIALAVRRAHPEMDIALVEAGDTFGGNHRWSWFDSDLGPEGDALMGAFRAKSWSGGNEVRFPGLSRHLSADYRSLDSRDFDAGLRTALPQSALHLNSRAIALAPDRVTMEDGRTIAARRVIDCRDPAPSPHLTGGWQVFLGQHRRMDAPHGVERPVIMDATVEQIGGYRFLYLLPLSDTELFLEDTYYQDHAVLDAAALRSRIADYCERHGWQGDLVHEETGLLPVITGGDFASHRASLEHDGVALAGARGGFVHPLTSYTVPIAVRTALATAEAIGGMDGPQLADYLAARARDHWRATGYYRLLGKMLFDAADPQERYRIFERFYGLPEPLIERFYAAQSSPFDKLRILSGKPPVPISAAIAALLGKGAPLVQGDP